MARHRSTVVIFVALVFVNAPIGAGQRSTESASLLESWVRAVETHVPGQPDEGVQAIWALTYEARRELNGSLEFFLRALTEGTGVETNRPSDSRVLQLVVEERRRMDAATFLRRAAVLHSDAAIFAPAAPVKPLESSVPLGARAAGPPLLFSGRMLVENDGELRGETAKDWNWVFARSLVDRLVRLAAAHSFARDWYHATAAAMFRAGAYGEVASHVDRAAVVLPNDGYVLFDRGCLSESYGLPFSQYALEEERLRERSGARPLWTRGTRSGLPEAWIANADAERLYRGAIGADPTLSEAHARLARLLTVRKRYEEAQSEAEAALKGDPDRSVAYYAHLFAGRAARAQGQYDAAAFHYERALALFSGAQSALLGASQVALLRSDVAGALVPIPQLAISAASTAERSDPWWEYRRCAGRDADALLESMWAQVLR